MDSCARIHALKDIARTAAKAILKERGSIQIVSHFDADGICAGTIMYKTLQYIGKDIELSFVKQLEEPVLQELSKNSKDLIIFTDLGSGQLDMIKKYLPERRIVVADHHQPVDIYWSGMHHVNPYIVGIDGKDSISGAGVVYMLSRELSVQTKKLVELALVGATGDMQQKEDQFTGINRVFLEEAEFSGLIKKEIGLRLFGRYTRHIHKALEYSTEPYLDGISGSESGAVQFLANLGIPIKDSNGNWRMLCNLTKKEEKKLATALVIESITSGSEIKKLIGTIYKLSNDYEIREFATMLNACGRLEMPLEGVKLCLGVRDVADDIQKEYRRKLSKSVLWFKRNVQNFTETEKATYIVAGDNIDDNFIGTVLSIAIKGYLKTNVVFGFANSESGVKVSARAKESASGLNLGAAIRSAAERVGGEGGGHTTAAGGKIPREQERRFIEIVDSLLYGC